MLINEDLSKRVFVHTSTLDWVPSPAAGVDRRMLYRVGNEVARATSIVRYAPGSMFPRHVHSGGEEILVLHGTFQDEYGDYPAGCYFRNPPGTSHVPASADGCTIFVRLWQFREGDNDQIVRKPENAGVPQLNDGANRRVLFFDGHEHVAIESWGPNVEVRIENPAGLEFLVLCGSMVLDEGVLEPECWGRLPKGNDLKAAAGRSGLRLWLKLGPLQHPDVVPMPS